MEYETEGRKEKEQVSSTDGAIDDKDNPEISDKRRSRHRHRKHHKEKGSKRRNEGSHKSRKKKGNDKDKENQPIQSEAEMSNHDKEQEIPVAERIKVTEENDSEYEFKRSVSWKSNIESSREFKSSVMEQNVLVSLEDPDNDYKTPKKEEQSSKKEHEYTWDQNSLGKNILFSIDRPHVVQRAVVKQSTDGARGSRGFISGRHTFQFKFNDKPWGSNCSIGICTADVNMHVEGYNHVFGCDTNSWVWDIPSGCLLHGGNSKQHFLTAIEEKSIYMTLDLNRGNLYFQPKGRGRFLAFKGLKDVKAEVFPCVSLVYGLSEVKISLKSTASPTSHDNIEKEKEKKIIQEKPVPSSQSLNNKENTTNTNSDTTNEDENNEVPKQKYQFTRYVSEPSTGKSLTRSDSMFSKSNGAEQSNRNMFSRSDTEQSSAGMFSRSDSMFSKNEKFVENEQKTGSLFSRNSDTEPKSGSMFSRRDPEPTTSLFSRGDSMLSRTDSSSEQKTGGIFSRSHTEISSTPASQLKQTNSEDSSKHYLEKSKSEEIPEQTEPVNVSENHTGGEDISDVNRDDYDDSDDDSTVDRHLLYKKQSNLSGWDPSNDVYLVHNGSIIRESISEKDVTGDETKMDLETEKIPDAAVYSRPTYQMKFENEPSDEEEPEDAIYTPVSDLELHEQYGLQMVHGWAVTNRGGSIQLYPGIPQICIPMPQFDVKVQAIRGKRSFTSGIHKWMIKELKMFSPSVSLDDMHVACNKLLVGVANSEQRSFNFGYNLNTVGPHAWVYELDTGLEWHGQGKKANFTQNAGNEDNGREPSGIDMIDGIEMTLNCYKHKLTISYKGKTLIDIKNIRGKELYPFLIFNKKGLFPIEIKYLEGPDDYIMDCLKQLDKMKSSDKEDLVSYMGLTRQVSSKAGMVAVEAGPLSVYDWGIATNSLKIKGGDSLKFHSNETKPGKHYVAIAEKPLCRQRHKIDFNTENIEHFIFGLTSETFEQDEIKQNGGIINTNTVSLLGSNVHSWGWDPKTMSLYHGGMFIGKYPSESVDFEIEKFDKLRLIVDFNSTNYNIASFTAMSSEPKHSLDLGIAFVNLPKSVYPSVAVVPGMTDEIIQLQMKYVAGPKDFVKERIESSVCTIL